VSAGDKLPLHHFPALVLSRHNGSQCGQTLPARRERKLPRPVVPRSKLMLLEDLPEGSSHSRVYITIMDQGLSELLARKVLTGASIVRLGTKEHASLRAPMPVQQHTSFGSFRNMTCNCWRSTVSPTRNTPVFSYASSQHSLALPRGGLTVHTRSCKGSILLFHIISARPSKQPRMVGSTLGVYCFGLILVSARTNKSQHHLGS
jgi:hypothetical protein